MLLVPRETESRIIPRSFRHWAQLVWKELACQRRSHTLQRMHMQALQQPVRKFAVGYVHVGNVPGLSAESQPT